MCWPIKKNNYESVKTPIMGKFKRCNKCQKKFRLYFNDYVKIKKKNKILYYCSTECYMKFFNNSNELFDIDLTD